MEEKEKASVDWYKIITMMEKTLLVIIAFLTTYAVVVEIITVVSIRAVKLTDLLLLFIYAKFWEWWLLFTNSAKSHNSADFHSYNGSL